MFVLAHLSDPHLGPLPKPHPFDLLSKRAIGFVNWHRGRKAIHRMEVLSAIVHDLKAQKPDHIALTGDLVNIALPSEFERSRPWLDPLGNPDELTIGGTTQGSSASPARRPRCARAGGADRRGRWPTR